MKKGANNAPFLKCNQWQLLVPNGTAKVAPYIDGSKEEEPHHINKVPVPSSRFEAEVLFYCHVAFVGADQANQQEDGSNEYVEAMKACRHKEGGAVD